VAGESASPPTYHISATLAPAAVLSNYIITNNGAEFSINKRPATWTTNTASKVYGESDPAFSGSGEPQGLGTGFLTADNVTATYSRAAGESASPPTYHISATLAPAAVLVNYIITNDGAEFTINKRPATWTTNSASKTYGDPDPSPITTGFGEPQGAGTGFLTADNVTATYSRAAGETVVGGPYHITATLTATPTSALANYVITNNGANFTINPKDLDVTANDRTKTYGVMVTFAGTEFMVGAGQLVAGDSVTSMTLTSAGAVGTATFTAPGPNYAIVPTNAVGVGLDNYTIHYHNGNLHINQAMLTITADSLRTKTYGVAYTQDTTPPSVDFSVSGLVNSDTVTSIMLTSSGYPASSTFTAPGPDYAVVPSGAVGTGLGNYNIGYVNGSIHVNQATLTITADSLRTKTYGVAYMQDTTPPSVDFSVSGLVNSDSVTLIVLTSSGYAASATFTAPGPNYAVVPSGALGTGLGNYNIGYVNGNIHVNQATLTITATNRSKVFGAIYTPTLTYPSPDFSVSGLLNADSVASITLTCAGYPSSALPTPSGYTITPSNAVGTGLSNYTITYVPGTFTIGYGICTAGSGHMILPPINSDGSSVYNRRRGSTIPVKFRVCDASGNNICDPNAVFASGVGGSITMVSELRGTVNVVNEDNSFDLPDVAFTCLGDHWQFNMDTMTLHSGSDYTFRINLKDGSSITFIVGLK
jgi:hypothetical protein